MGPNKRLTYGDHPLVLENLPRGTLKFGFGRINGDVTARDGSLALPVRQGRAIDVFLSNVSMIA